MASKSGKELRCAIYTRKSTDHGLELEFNSLDAQREACEAYIKSQASEGWRALSERYDDPAFSGGNLERPAVRRLLKDIEAGLIDVVVVYKIDRLTRSLTDFAKLVEVFDAKSVSFVAVTQQFNTTTSMGRLTLNVLLSFAQFERELASERVRDKVAASRKKGIWTGGSVPLGYETKDKKLVVHAREAATVRTIFERYLQLQSFQKLIDELNSKGIVTKTRSIQGRVAGGVPFNYGSLAYLLNNRTYVGETGFKGAWFPGEHDALVSLKTFNSVQELLRSNSEGRTGRRQHTGALLTGLLFDDRGNRMSPSFSVKGGVRYPYYVSSALLRGHKDRVGSMSRVSAPALEEAIMRATRDHLKANNEPTDGLPRQLLERAVTEIAVGRDRTVIAFGSLGALGPAKVVIGPVNTNKNQHTQIEGNDNSDAKRAVSPLLPAIVRAHAWLGLLSDGTHESVEALASAVGFHPKVVRKFLPLAFLAPALTAEILQGQPLGGSAQCKIVGSIPISWIEQHFCLTPGAELSMKAGGSYFLRKNDVETLRRS